MQSSEAGWSGAGRSSPQNSIRGQTAGTTAEMKDRKGIEGVVGAGVGQGQGIEKAQSYPLESLSCLSQTPSLVWRRKPENRPASQRARSTEHRCLSAGLCGKSVLQGLFVCSQEVSKEARDQSMPLTFPPSCLPACLPAQVAPLGWGPWAGGAGVTLQKGTVALGASAVFQERADC